jgi:hypothetical protein
MAQEWSYDTSKVYTVHRTVCPCAVAETAGVENEQYRWYMEALVNGQHLAQYPHLRQTHREPTPSRCGLPRHLSCPSVAIRRPTGFLQKKSIFWQLIIMVSN